MHRTQLIDFWQNIRYRIRSLHCYVILNVSTLRNLFYLGPEIITSSDGNNEIGNVYGDIDIYYANPTNLMSCIHTTSDNLLYPSFHLCPFGKI